MRCFTHNDRDAIGMCKTCCKGLCAECAVDLGHGLSCHGSHEGRVQLLDQIVRRSAAIQSTAGSARYLAPAFIGFMGLVFLLTGIYLEPGSTFLKALGGGFVIYGVAVTVVNRRAFGKSKSDA